MADRPALVNGEEIEVTPEMVAAGVCALADLDSRFDDEQSVVAAVFRAMASQKLGVAGGGGSSSSVR